MLNIYLSFPETALLVIVSFFLALPVWWSWRLGWAYLFHPADPPLPDAGLPSVAVILPLRGADPSLRDCLRKLLAQDYPRFSLRIVVDNPDDPAWRLVEEVLAERPNANVEVRLAPLRRHCASCALKVSAQLQAAAELEPDVDVIALIDADTLPPRDWLRTLVTPLADPTVGAVTGIRWFAPARPTWGALVRQLWNAGSQPQMAAFAIPWGGTLAMPTRLLRGGELAAQWQRSFCDDTGASELLRRRGLKVRMLPALTMVNREAVDLPGCIRFLRRQLLCPRIDMSTWPAILTVNAGWLLSVAVAASLAVAGVALDRPAWLLWFGGVLLLYLAGIVGTAWFGEWLIRRVVHRRGESVPPSAPLWKLAAAAIMAQTIHCYCLAAAVCARRVHWRGVDYRIEGPQRIQLIQYRPFQPTRQADPNHSIV